MGWKPLFEFRKNEGSGLQLRHAVPPPRGLVDPWWILNIAMGHKCLISRFGGSCRGAPSLRVRVFSLHARPNPWPWNDRSGGKKNTGRTFKTLFFFFLELFLPSPSMCYIVTLLKSFWWSAFAKGDEDGEMDIFSCWEIVLVTRHPVQVCQVSILLSLSATEIQRFSCFQCGIHWDFLWCSSLRLRKVLENTSLEVTLWLMWWMRMRRMRRMRTRRRTTNGVVSTKVSRHDGTTAQFAPWFAKRRRLSLVVGRRGYQLEGLTSFIAKIGSPERLRSSRSPEATSFKHENGLRLFVCLGLFQSKIVLSTYF